MAEARADAGARPAGLAVRLASMIYEGVLLFGVAFAAGLAVFALTGWSGPLEGARRLVLQAALFAVIGLYFVSCWTRTGQTLALKTWRLRVVAAGDRPPALGRAITRYVLSWHLWLPGLLAIAWLQPSRALGFAALAAGFAVLLLPAVFDPQRRLLHERWSGTRIVATP
jgi:uncharacterized RDD family membrane protein YckC